MRIVLQRVQSAAVTVDERPVSVIGMGYLLLCCVEQDDTEASARWLAEKILKLRLYPNEDGRVNDRSLMEVGGEILLVSQFTLVGNVERGSRPDYTGAASPAKATQILDLFRYHLSNGGVAVAQGSFGEHMQVSLVNDGPVTLLLQR